MTNTKELIEYINLIHIQSDSEQAQLKNVLKEFQDKIENGERMFD